MKQIFFEQIDERFQASSGPYHVTEEEILEFGRRFDPRPFHTDPIAAKESVFGGLVAPGSLTFAIRSALVNQLQPAIAYQAGLGLENLQLPRAVRPGDRLFLSINYLEKRESKSRPKEGIVRFLNTLTNQHDDIVLTMISSVLVKKQILPKSKDQKLS